MDLHILHHISLHYINHLLHLSVCVIFVFAIYAKKKNLNHSNAPSLPPPHITYYSHNDLLSIVYIKKDSLASARISYIYIQKEEDGF